MVTGAPAAGMLATLSPQSGRAALAASRSLDLTWVELQQMSPALLAHMSMSLRAQQQVRLHQLTVPVMLMASSALLLVDMQLSHPAAAVSLQGAVLPLLQWHIKGPLVCRCDNPGPSTRHQHCSSRGRIMPLVFSWRLQGWARVCRRPPRTCVLQVSLLLVSCCKLRTCLQAVWGRARQTAEGEAAGCLTCAVQCAFQSATLPRMICLTKSSRPPSLQAP